MFSSCSHFELVVQKQKDEMKALRKEWKLNAKKVVAGNNDKSLEQWTKIKNTNL